MIYGSGSHTYEVQEGWGQLPEGWKFGWIPAVAVDSQDRIYVYSRSERPMVVFDREGNFLASWGEDILKDSHGIFIDAEDHIYCVEREVHIMHKFTADGELLMTLGTPDQPGAEGEPFICRQISRSVLTARCSSAMDTATHGFTNTPPMAST